MFEREGVMSKCIDPSEVKEGSLAAYIDGQASEKVRAHVERCPHCAAQVEAQRRTTAIARAALYRLSCPDSEELGLYQLRLLPASEQLIVARHVRECPHCQRELAELARADDAPSLPERVRQAVSVIEARLTPMPHQAARAFRGPSASSRRFRTDDLELHVSVQPGHGRGRWTVMGRLSPLDSNASLSPGMEIWLMQDGEAWAAAVETGGVFAFEDVSPGTYALSLEWAGQAVVAREVVVS